MLIANPKLDPSANIGGEWSRETIEDALGRATEFGRAFFARLFAELPEIRNELVFLQHRDPILGINEDVYAMLDRPVIGFGVQIDTVMQYIVIWSEFDHGEHADWGKGNDPVEDALVHIRTCLARTAG